MKEKSYKALEQKRKREKKRIAEEGVKDEIRKRFRKGNYKPLYVQTSLFDFLPDVKNIDDI